MASLTQVSSLLFDNSSQRQTLLKNSVWLSVADGASRLVKFFVTLYVIRLLGSYEYGKFAFAFAFVSLFSTLFDFGLSPVVTREFAKDQKQELSFSAILGLKVAIGLIVLTFIGVNGYLMS